MNQRKKSRGPLLDHLDEIEEFCRNRDPKLKEIFEIFGADGHLVLVLFLILPFLQPVPLFGLSTPFGFLIAIIIVFAYFNKPPLLPQRWAQKSVPRVTVDKIAQGAEKVFDRLSHFLRPRLTFLFQGIWRHFNFFIMLSHALLLTLPLPIPFSNAIPAWVIFFQALSYLEKDGFLLIGSYLLSLLSLSFFLALLSGFQHGLDYLSQFFNL